MMWLVGGAYCFVLWLVFAKFKLLRLSLPIAVLAGSIGPAGILALLFCAQYYHPISGQLQAVQKVIPVVPQTNRAGRVTEVRVQPNVPVKAGDVLFEVDRIPYENAVSRLTAALVEAEQSIKVAAANIDVAVETWKQAKANLDFATSTRDRTEKLLAQDATTQKAMDQATAEYEDASARFRQAESGRAQAAASLELSKGKRQQAQTELDDATYDLRQTTVLAPSDGFVVNLQLQPGMLVGGAGASSVMSFVQDRNEREAGVVVAMYEQKSFLLIKPGQYAEVALDAYPGQIMTGKVLNTIDMSPEGQLAATGVLPSDFASGPPARFPVRIKLDGGEQLRLPGGLHGIAAVYTDNVAIAGIPVMFVMRMESWMRYLF